MDQHPAIVDDLPIVELRSANKPILYANAGTWATELFDYIVSLNNNPGSGHAVSDDDRCGDGEIGAERRPDSKLRLLDQQSVEDEFGSAVEGECCGVVVDGQ